MKLVIAPGAMHESQAEHKVLHNLNDAIAAAERAGFVVTADQVSLQPLAMGNYETIVTVRRARG